MSTSADETPLLLAFKDQFPCWPLIVSALSLNLVATVGMALNFGVIWTTARNKSLHGTANWLLAICSLFELLHQHGHWLFLFTALSPHHFLDLLLAFRLCSLSLFGLNGIVPFLFFTGLDRFLCVFFPAFPKWVRPVPYLGLICLVCAGNSLLRLYYMNQVIVEYPHVQVVGTIGDYMQIKDISTDNSYHSISLVIQACTMLLYLVVGIRMRLKSAHSSNWEQNQRRLFRALLLIISLNVGGYFLMALFRVVFAPRISSSVTVWFIMQALAVFTNLGAASNGPILYWTSKEYRKAFDREFDQLRLLFRANHSRSVTKMPQNEVVRI